jgi:hypothetical protein
MQIENVSAIRKLQVTLLKIKNKDPVFFNVTQFEKLGLVRAISMATHKNSSSTGEPLRKTEYVLTAKANQFLNVAI